LLNTVYADNCQENKTYLKNRFHVKGIFSELFTEDILVTIVQTRVVEN